MLNTLDAVETLFIASVAVTVKELSPSDNSELGVIENIPVVASAVVVPIDASPLSSSTVLPASAVPIIIGVVSLVVVSVVVNVGADGAVVSTVMLSELDAAEVFPAVSVAVTVKA